MNNNSKQPKLPKGAYRLPTGGYVTKSSGHTQSGRKITIRVVHNDPPDCERLARAFLALAEYQLAWRQPGETRNCAD